MSHAALRDDNNDNNDDKVAATTPLQHVRHLLAQRRQRVQQTRRASRLRCSNSNGVYDDDAMCVSDAMPRMVATPTTPAASSTHTTPLHARNSGSSSHDNNILAATSPLQQQQSQRAALPRPLDELLVSQRRRSHSCSCNNSSASALTRVGRVLSVSTRTALSLDDARGLPPRPSCTSTSTTAARLCHHHSSSGNSAASTLAQMLLTTAQALQHEDDGSGNNTLSRRASAAVASSSRRGTATSTSPAMSVVLPSVRSSAAATTTSGVGTRSDARTPSLLLSSPSLLSSSSLLSTTAPAMTAKQLTEALYAAGAGGVLARVAYTHFLDEAHNNNNNNNNTSDTARTSQRRRSSYGHNSNNSSKACRGLHTARDDVNAAERDAQALLHARDTQCAQRRMHDRHDRCMSHPPSDDKTVMSCAGSRVRYVQASNGMRRLAARANALAHSNSSSSSSSSNSNDDDVDSGSTDWTMVRVLVVGAGGIGCEVLHLLALSGFADITVVDMDTIELTNLNRQFLFQRGDVGKPKSTVAAACIAARCAGVCVRGVVGRVEEQSDDFYLQFDVIVMALDSVEARRFVNRKIAQLAVWEVAPCATSNNNKSNNNESNNNNNNDSNSNSNSCTPTDGMRYCYRIKQATLLIDTATGGLQGQCRVIRMAHNATACVECSMHVYETRTAQVPLCTLENIPRNAQHCVLYAQLKLWPDYQQEQLQQQQQQRTPGDGARVTPVPLDVDKPEHLAWVAQRARARQRQFGIAGPPIDEAFTLGVVKNVVPAVGFTNALVAAQAVGEVLKLVTGAAPLLRNYAFYDGATAHGTRHRRETLRPPRDSDSNSDSARCAVCGPLPVVVMPRDATPRLLLRALLQRVLSPSQLQSLLRQQQQGDDVWTRATLTLRVAVTEAGATVLRDVALLPSPSSPATHHHDDDTRVIECVRRAGGAEQALQLWCSSRDDGGGGGGGVSHTPVVAECTLPLCTDDGSVVSRYTAVVTVAHDEDAACCC